MRSRFLCRVHRTWENNLSKADSPQHTYNSDSRPFLISASMYLPLRRYIQQVLCLRQRNEQARRITWPSLLVRTEYMDGFFMVLYK